MTQTTQYATIVALLRRSDERLQRLEDRMAFEFPTPAEARAQIDAEIDSILAPGGGVRVFEDES